MLRPRSAKYWVPAIGLFLFVSLALLQHQNVTAQARSYLWQDKSKASSGTGKGQNAGSFMSTSTPTQWDSDDARVFWEQYFKILTDGAPNGDEIRFRDDFKSTMFPPSYKGTELFTAREQFLDMTQDEVDGLTSKHTQTKESIKELATRLPYVPGTRGIVYSTDMGVMPFLIVSIRMLRKSGTTLPVEVWMWNKFIWGFDPKGLQLCEEVLRPLGAICRFTAEYLPRSQPPPYDKPTEKYQNKFDALMFSSFEHVAMLDSDNVPIMPLDDVFLSEPFAKHGLVLWPDYWRNIASPYFFKVTSVEQQPSITRASTESGQLFLNKATHGGALLLARYYGLYPKHWIRLLSQDPNDEGDKETFQHAARALDLPFYQVAEPPDRVGYRCDQSHPLGSGQHHPVDDYYLSSMGIKRQNTNEMLNDGVVPRTMFIHCNLPKLDAALLAPGDGPKESDFRYCDGEVHRMWGPRHLTILKYGWDVEKAVWDQMRYVACETINMQSHWTNPDPKYGHATLDSSTICSRFVTYYEEIMDLDGGKANGLTYDSALTPSPYDENGEFTKGYEAQKKQWAGQNWRWPLAKSALESKARAGAT